MGSLDKAVNTQLENIQKKSGKSMEELGKVLKESGLTKHGEIRQMFMDKLGLGHGDANTLTHHLMKSDGTSAAKAKGLSEADVVGEIYAGKKADLRPIHDKLMAEINQFGEFETVPKKGYVSLRRKKQFAMIGPTTATRVDVGINLKGLDGTDRLIAQPPGGMCQYNVKVTAPTEVDQELVGWLKQAYDGAG